MKNNYRRLFGAAAVFLLFVTYPSHASDYSVQFAALRTHNESYLQAAHQVGTVFAGAALGGITRYYVGHYNTRDEARVALHELRAVGYSDAFVRGGELKAQETIDASRPTRQSVLSDLPADLRDRVVLLDGVLHVKEGDQFTPLAQFQP